MYILGTLCQLSLPNDTDWTWDVAKIELYRMLSTLTVILFLLLFPFSFFLASDSNSKNWNCLPGFVIMLIESLHGWRKRGDLLTPCQESVLSGWLPRWSDSRITEDSGNRGYRRNSWNSLIYGTACNKKRAFRERQLSCRSIAQRL